MCPCLVDGLRDKVWDVVLVEFLMGAVYCEHMTMGTKGAVCSLSSDGGENKWSALTRYDARLRFLGPLSPCFDLLATFLTSGRVMKRRSVSERDASQARGRDGDRLLTIFPGVVPRDAGELEKTRLGADEDDAVATEGASRARPFDRRKRAIMGWASSRRGSGRRGGSRRARRGNRRERRRGCQRVTINHRSSIEPKANILGRGDSEIQ